jgi:Antibiotic biosynthesis monooxygenase
MGGVRRSRQEESSGSPAYDGLVLIIAGSLIVDPADRASFLAANADVVVRAREATGCLDFVQAADPIDPSRINIFERWEREDHLLAFRGAGQPSSDSPPIQSATVMRYVISAVEEP